MARLSLPPSPCGRTSAVLPLKMRDAGAWESASSARGAVKTPMRRPSVLSVPGDDCSSVGRNARFVQCGDERERDLMVDKRLFWRAALPYPVLAVVSTQSVDSALAALLAQPSQANHATKFLPKSAQEMIVALMRVALPLSMPRNCFRLRCERKNGVGPVFGLGNACERKIPASIRLPAPTGLHTTTRRRKGDAPWLLEFCLAFWPRA